MSTLVREPSEDRWEWDEFDEHVHEPYCSECGHCSCAGCECSEDWFRAYLDEMEELDDET